VASLPVSPLPADLGDGVVLRHYEMTDLDALWSAIEAERARLAVWMPFLRDAKTIDDERAWLESVTAEPRGFAGGSLWRADDLLGGVGLVPDAFGIVAEIGYWVRSTEEGRGLVTRACRKLIDAAIFSSETGLRKPDPAIYLAATEALGVEPGRCLYCGDGAYGELTGATAVGMTAVLIRPPDLDVEEALTPEPEEDWRGLTIGDLRELLGLLEPTVEPV
jgi:beta-phosphoglucomutase-like phosphatase (HAD superfamily)